jgi:NAD(P)H-dependent FMN reductase
VKPKLHIIVASTRPGRVGLPIARWFQGEAEIHGGFDLQWVDLAEWNLPFMDEPEHPRFRRYTHEHTFRWSAHVDSADAFVMVTPEYNHAFNAPLKNAIDYLIHEWAYKPVGIVSYGGIAAGTRAMQLLTPVLVGLKMTPTLEAVNIPQFGRLIQDGELQPTESMSRAAQLMLDEIQRIEEALRGLRAATRALQHAPT